MSADNGFIVKHALDPNEPDIKIAVFYYQGDAEPYTPKNGIRWVNTMSGALSALVSAHIWNYKDPTEYGVSVTKEVLNIIEPGAINEHDA